MERVINARLDKESATALKRLQDALGWTPSELIRAALKGLAAQMARPGKSRIIGLGKFSSGLKDLGSNKEHLKGFGR